MVQNTPYTYLIGWTTHNKWYYGVRYSKKCDPTDLWKTYFTSSKHVKRFREENGEPDVIQVRKTFETPDLARYWEGRVLKRINVINEDKWINKTDNKCIMEERAFRSSDYMWINNSLKEKYIRKDSALPNNWKMGRLFRQRSKKTIISDETRMKISIANKNKKKPDGFGENIRKIHLGRKRSDETRKRISDSKKGMASRSKTWIFFLNGKRVEIYNLSKYCKENNLNISCMRDVYRGRQNQHKNYKREI